MQIKDEGRTEDKIGDLTRTFWLFCTEENTLANCLKKKPRPPSQFQRSATTIFELNNKLINLLFNQVFEEGKGK